MRANSDKSRGLNGFLNEIPDNLHHLILSAEAREIEIIKKEQVINIIDSVVQKMTFAGGEGASVCEYHGQRSAVHRDQRGCGGGKVGGRRGGEEGTRESVCVAGKSVCREKRRREKPAKRLKRKRRRRRGTPLQDGCEKSAGDYYAKKYSHRNMRKSRITSKAPVFSRYLNMIFWRCKLGRDDQDILAATLIL